MLENLTKKQKIIFGIIISFMIVVIIYYIYSTLNQYEHTSLSSNIDEELLLNTASSENMLEDTAEDTVENSKILVHVSGCVKNNIVVTLPEGSRINDAIEAAGGLTEDADLTNINLAYILEDGEKIYIPKKGEELLEDSFTSSNSDISTSSSVNHSSTSTKISKININKASQTELETIPGIGPSTALKIIDYRQENGKFKSIEDIKNVSGIGDAKYEKMKDYIIAK